MSIFPIGKYLSSMSVHSSYVFGKWIGNSFDEIPCIIICMFGGYSCIMRGDNLLMEPDNTGYALGHFSVFSFLGPHFSPLLLKINLFHIFNVLKQPNIGKS